MAKLGFCGLGIMGYPMARHLLEAGHEVALWSNTAAKARELASAAGGRFCDTPQEVGSFAECSFLCVGDTAMSESVVAALGDGAAPGSVVVDCSTVSPSASRAMGERLGAKGVHFLDAPCTGSKPGAEGGNLTFMIGGDREVFERVRPFFEPMGKSLFYCGGPGMGLHAKLTQNLILSNMLEAINEGLVLSTKAGVDPNLMLEILNASAAKSGLLAYKAPFIFRRDFATNFATKWMHKDLGLMLESANELGVPLPITAVTQQMFRAAIASGWGEEDMCGTIRVLEGWSGKKVEA